MYDICLHGHLTIDKIFETNRSFETLGAMANLWDAFIKIDYNLNIGLDPWMLGEAIIFADTEKNIRVSRSVMNVKKIKRKETQSKIDHFLYINELEDIPFNNYKGMITADVCLGKTIDVDCLKHVDLLFLSDEDSNNLEMIIKKTKGWVLLHHSRGSICYYKDKKFEFTIPDSYIVKNVNVIGAGDRFAASVLKLLVNNNLSELPILVKDAHRITSELLKDEK